MTPQRNGVAFGGCKALWQRSPRLGRTRIYKHSLATGSPTSFILVQILVTPETAEPYLRIWCDPGIQTFELEDTL
jgi:hypothetical protein